MLLSRLVDKLLRRQEKNAHDDWNQIWSEWDVRRTAAEETGEPFDEPPPQDSPSGKKRRRWGRPSAVDAGVAGTTGVFLAGSHIDQHHGGQHHGGHDGGMHGGGGDAGGVF